MIPLDKLKNIKHLVTHGPACPDGISSALIVKDALPDVRVSFMAYNTAELAALKAEPGLLFVDFTPPRDRVAEFVEAGAICLDHHPTAKDIVEAFGENGVFGENEKNECGAWLAYTEVWKQIAEPKYTHAWAHERDKVRDFAQLAAIRDTWKKDDPRWQQACEQAATLVFFGVDRFLGMSWGFVEDQIESVGSVLLDKQLSAARRSIEEAHCFTSAAKGTKVLAFQGVSTTSDVAELMDNEKDEQNPFQRLVDDVYHPDLVVGFHYRSDAGKLQLQFSMRSHTGYDCAAFAKAHGGGGHKAAAGFTVEVSPEIGVNPYRLFQLLLDEWEG